MGFNPTQYLNNEFSSGVSFHPEFSRDDGRYEDYTPEKLEALHNNYVDEEGVLWKKSRCFACHLVCGVYVGSKDGKVVAIAPDKSQGTELCERHGKNGIRMVKFNNHPDRINHALKRVGERGEGKWEKISVEQALDEIAEKLLEVKAKYGPESLVVAEGTYRTDHIWAARRFASLFGNACQVMGPGHICAMWKVFQQEAIYGRPPVFFGHNAPQGTKTRYFGGMRAEEFYANRSIVSRIMKEELWGDTQRPYKILVVDPCCTTIARNADLWLPIRPGTDAALKLGMGNIIVQEKLYDADFLRDWTTAPFLVRTDTKKLLREPAFAGKGNRHNFVAWDPVKGKAVLWISDTRKFAEDGVVPALEGEFDVKLASGETVKCKTAFTLIVENLAEYPLETVAQITGLPEQKIEAAARMLMDGPASFTMGRGDADQSGNQVNNLLAENYLMCFTGAVDGQGGQEMYGVGPHINGVRVVRDAELEGQEFISAEAKKKTVGYERYPLNSWQLHDLVSEQHIKYHGTPREITHCMNVHPGLVWEAAKTGKPFPVKAIISWHTDLMTWAANTKHVVEGLKAMDLVVQMEYWMTPAAALADYVLPAADWMERPFFSTMEDVFDFAATGDRGIRPQFDRQIDYDFFRGLAIRCGQEEHWPWKTYEDVVAMRVEKCGVSYDEVIEMGTIMDPHELEKYKQVRKDGTLRGWDTASGRVEIFPTLYDELGIYPILPYREPAESPYSTPELYEQYPFVLTSGGRTIPFFHSDGRVPDIGTREMHPWPVFMMNIETGRQLGIRDGDWCWIETPRGRIRQRARLGNEIGQKVIQIQASWWYPEMRAEEPVLKGIWESSANVLTNDDPDAGDPYIGGWANRCLLCKVYRCEEPPEWFDERKFLPIAE